MVVPHEGTWIEICQNKKEGNKTVVVPHEGTWIEMLIRLYFPLLRRSFPTREYALPQPASIDVVPHEGTWIEIGKGKGRSNKDLVVPHEGTWIEMAMLW